MGDFADVKRKRICSLLLWLNTLPNVSVEDGGKHQYLIRYPGCKRPFPIPFKHNAVNKNIVKKLASTLIEFGVCTENEFRDHIR